MPNHQYHWHFFLHKALKGRECEPTFEDSERVGPSWDADPSQDEHRNIETTSEEDEELPSREVNGTDDAAVKSVDNDARQRLPRSVVDRARKFWAIFRHEQSPKCHLRNRANDEFLHPSTRAENYIWQLDGEELVPNQVWQEETAIGPTQLAFQCLQVSNDWSNLGRCHLWQFQQRQSSARYRTVY